MKVLITPRSFGKNNPDLFLRLQMAGLEVVRNETGGILSEADMCRLITDCEGLILGVDPLNAKVLANAPRLKAVSRYGVGLDNIDLKECERRGIKVSRTLGAINNAVADYAFTLMMGVARRIALGDRQCRSGDWSKITGVDLYGKTLGIIGLGAVGKCVAKRARGFEMRILASDPKWDEAFAADFDIARVDVDTICREADFITLHCILNEETRKLINASRLAMMKSRAILINTARGGLIDEAALLAVLEKGEIWGAGLDVFEHEPPENPLWRKLNNVIISSHCSSSTFGATELMGTISVDHLLQDLDLKA